MGFVECVPNTVWGMQTYTSTNCTFFQECLPNRFSSSPPFICDCKNTEFLLDANEYGNCTNSPSSTVLVIIFVLLALFNLFTIFLFRDLRGAAAKKRQFLVRDLVSMVVASSLSLFGRCILIVVRTSSLSVQNNTIISAFYVVCMLAILLTICMGAMIYILFVYRVTSNAAVVMTDQNWAHMRVSLLRSSILYGSASCVLSGFPYIYGLATIAHAGVSLSTLFIVFSFVFVLGKIDKIVQTHTKQGWRTQPIYELRKSFLIALLPLVVFVLCTFVYVLCWFLGHEHNNTPVIRYGLCLAMIIEHLSGNAFQLGICFAMRAIVKKPSMDRLVETSLISSNGGSSISWTRNQPRVLRSNSNNINNNNNNSIISTNSNSSNSSNNNRHRSGDRNKNWKRSDVASRSSGPSPPHDLSRGDTTISTNTSIATSQADLLPSSPPATLRSHQQSPKPTTTAQPEPLSTFSFLRVWRPKPNTNTTNTIVSTSNTTNTTNNTDLSIMVSEPPPPDTRHVTNLDDLDKIQL